MFEATLSEARIFKNTLEAIKDLITQTNFECSKNGITLQSMDSSHVSLLNLVLRADGFESYRCDKSMSLGIEIKSLTQILKCARNDDKVTLKAMNKDKLIFIFKNSDKTQKFELKLLEIDNETLAVPDTEYAFKIKGSSHEFQKTCRNLSMFGDSISIDVDSNSLKFTTVGENSSTDTVFNSSSSSSGKNENNEKFMIKASDGSISQTFSLKYLSFFAKGANLSNNVKFLMSEDVPMVIQYKIEDFGYIKYYIAPKIDQE